MPHKLKDLRTFYVFYMILKTCFTRYFCDLVVNVIQISFSLFRKLSLERETRESMKNIEVCENIINLIYCLIKEKGERNKSERSVFFLLLLFVWIEIKK